jgi:uncharacterized DUF497 family protein
MDERFDLNGIGFIWNAKKAAANEKKHGITFEEASTVFFDPFIKLVNASPDEESRDAIIGTAEDGRLLFVVHIAFEQELVRIISARKATRSERLSYEE